MFRSLHMKLVLIMVLLIVSLMTVVGAFLINSVVSFYLKDFYTQMAEVFCGTPSLLADLDHPRRRRRGERAMRPVIQDPEEPTSAPWGSTTATATTISWTARPASYSGRLRRAGNMRARPEHHPPT